MRLRGLRRREEPVLVGLMGGFRFYVEIKRVGLGKFGDQGEADQAILRFDSSDAFPDHAPFGSNAMVDNRGAIRFEYRQRGSFTEQAPKLINRVSGILGLFPLMVTDFRTKTTFLVNRDWLTPLNILNQEMRLNDQVIKRFRAKAEIPLSLSEASLVHLCTEGELVIKNNTVLFEGHGNIFEKETGLETSADELFIAEAELDFDQQIMRRMNETIGGLPLHLTSRYHPNSRLVDKEGKPIMVFESFGADRPVHGKDVIRWILRAALDCGMTFSLADLTEYDIDPSVAQTA